MCDKVGFKSGGIGGGIVVNFSGYFGFWEPNLWEWVAAQSGASNG